MIKSQSDSKGLQKNTSLQAWGKIAEKYFQKKIRVEERKDREHIYSLLNERSLPTEKFVAYSSGEKITSEELEETVKKLGFPYWISATPKLETVGLGRLSKLRLENVGDGWKFIKSISKLSDYKIIVMQYADNPEFKGSVLISKELNGIADFVMGDNHVQLTSGLTITDPMLFDKSKIRHYSEMIPKSNQDLLYSYISKYCGHFEFQYGTIEGKVGLSFFDYNDELAYENMDKLFQDLLIYHDHKTNNSDSKVIVSGLPACLGKAEGKCKVILSKNLSGFSHVEKGDVLVSDTTTPEMTPVMNRVSAIITDLGGVTSHAAIVCRELGIPCIVGAKNATTLLKNGMNLKVDASKGTVSEV